MVIYSGEQLAYYILQVIMLFLQIIGILTLGWLAVNGLSSTLDQDFVSLHHALCNLLPQQLFDLLLLVHKQAC